MDKLLPRFRKTFFWSFSFKKWEPKFLALPPIHQQALLLLVEGGVTCSYAYDAIKDIPLERIKACLDDIIEDILFDYRGNVTGW